MMSQRHYLLFIDNEPVSEELKDYFEKFNLDIIQQKKLFPIHVEKGLPTAILINWSILRTEPEAI
ncbi:TPA: DNA-binding response regulator, partial [Legionella pneumophila]|nr:DNA-binding response regulator [Legionella pneumophila]